MKPVQTLVLVTSMVTLSLASSFTPSALAARRVSKSPSAGRFVLVSNKITRTYELSGPFRTKSQQPRPLVIQLHGGGGTGAKLDKLTRFGELAGQFGFVVASPDGIEGNWNDGRTDVDAAAFTRKIDDVAFLEALIDDAAKRTSIDPSEVFVIGISNGAFMASRFACERSKRVRAIGLVAGTIAPNVESACKPAQPISVIDFHGTADPLVPYEGGTVGQNRGQAVGVEAMLQDWTAFNSIDQPPTESTYSDITERNWRNAQAAMRAYRITGGGHTWPGGDQYAPKRLVGTTTQTIDATKLAWQFFASAP